MESGLFVPESTWDCQYEWNELPEVRHDWTWQHCQDRLARGAECNTSDSQPSGLLDLSEGLMRSCNPFFWHIGYTLYQNNRPNDIANMARAFGLGSLTGSFFGAIFIWGLPIVLRNAPGVFGSSITAATIEHITFMTVGVLIIFFLIVEPAGLARLWQIGKQKLRVWPFPY